MASNEFNLIHELPDNAYVKMTGYLSVNDIENLKKSGIDERTDLAYANIVHVVIYLYDLIGLMGYYLTEEALRLMRAEVMCLLDKLPSTIKTIKMYGFNDRWYFKLFPNGAKYNFAEKFPYLESFGNDSDTYLVRLKTNKLKTIRDRYLQFACDATYSALSKSTCLRKLRLDTKPSDSFCQLLSTFKQLEVFSFDMIPPGEDGPIRMALIDLRDSLKVIEITDRYPDDCEHVAFLNEFLDFCTSLPFQTKLHTCSNRLDSLTLANTNLIYSIYMTEFNEKVTSLQMLEKLYLPYETETYELFKTLADLRTINPQLKGIELVSYDRNVLNFVPLGRFLMTHSDLVNDIELQVGGNAKVLVSMLAMVELRLKSATLYLHDEPTNDLDFDDIESLYSVSVHELFSIYSYRSNQHTVFKEAKPKIMDRKCIINLFYSSL